jgi:DNA-binding NtrC family response regulator
VAETILICDDDPDIRAAMRRTLRNYACTEVSSPREALDLLRTTTFDAIVSDFSMGADSDGLDLLQHIKLMYPTMVRFLVTANRDIETATRAVNEGAVHRYFLKPWNDDQLRSALQIMLRTKAH